MACTPLYQYLAKFDIAHLLSKRQEKTQSSKFVCIHFNAQISRESKRELSLQRRPYGGTGAGSNNDGCAAASFAKNKSTNYVILNSSKIKPHRFAFLPVPHLSISHPRLGKNTVILFAYISSLNNSAVYGK